MNWLDFAAQLFQDQIYPIMLVIVILALLTVRKKEVFLISLAAVYLFTPVVKDFYAVERPCAGTAACPESFSFPSTHAALSFVLVAASIGSPVHFFFLPLALFISYTRLYLGVHTLEQVAGGTAFAFVVYFLVDWLVAGLREHFGIKTLWQVIPRGAGA